MYLSSFCQRAAGDGLRRILGPPLETDPIFDAVLSVNYCAIAICVSVRAVQEKCDEKGGDLAWAKLRLAADLIAIVLPGNILEHLSAMSYVEREEKREQFLKDAFVAWTHYQATGLHATTEEADAWLSKLEASKDAVPPKCHSLRAPPPFASR